jgi:LL-diaminopimelate aminotransferase
VGIRVELQKLDYNSLISRIFGGDQPDMFILFSEWIFSAPEFIIEAMTSAIKDPENHRYPTSAGMTQFREAASRFMERRFKVKIGPEQIVALIGSKEGIAHIPLAFVNPGDYVLVPSPGYPVYRVSTLFAGGTPYFLPLQKENGFLPKLSEIPKTVAEKSKLLFINYPNNPTSAIAEKPFFEEVVAFAQRYQIIVCHDAAYSEVAYGAIGRRAFCRLGAPKRWGSSSTPCPKRTT